MTKEELEEFERVFGKFDHDAPVRTPGKFTKGGAMNGKRRVVTDRDDAVLSQLHQRGGLDGRTIRAALAELRQSGAPLVEWLIRSGIYADHDDAVAEELARHYGLSTMSVIPNDLDIPECRRAAAGFCRQFHVAYVASEHLGRFVVAEDPIDITAIEQIETWTTSRSVYIRVGTRAFIRRLLDIIHPCTGPRYAPTSYSGAWRASPTMDAYLDEAVGVADEIMRAETRLHSGDTNTTTPPKVNDVEDAPTTQPKLRLIKGGLGEEK